MFAGGCFWGVDAVFKHVKGVTNVVSGYSGGNAATAHYEMVSEGNTGHAESVRVQFDPTQVSYQQLLQVFFNVAHDPTELNRQGPDTGSQYRSVIFYANAEQEKIAHDYIQQLTAMHRFSSPIVTQVVPLKQFYPAEEHHQNYLELASRTSPISCSTTCPSWTGCAEHFRICIDKFAFRMDARGPCIHFRFCSSPQYILLLQA